jgi:hypothetical protein
MTNTDSPSPQMQAIDRAAERAAELRAGGAADSIVAPLTVASMATPDTVELLLGSLNKLLRHQARAGVVPEQAHQEIVHLRTRLAGWKDGWLGKPGSVTIPVVTLDDNGQIIAESSIALAV